MKKIFYILFSLIFLSNQVNASDNLSVLKQKFVQANNVRAVKALLNSQVKYANKEDFDRFITTYDKSYLNSDGLDLNAYSKLVSDIWDTYDNIKYGIKIKNIKIQDNNASVELVETSDADISVPQKMNGVLRSKSNSVYNLKKIGGKWKVVSDSVLDETTSIMYGEAMNLDVKLTAPNNIAPNTEYTASLEFETPKGIVSIASISNDKVEYPQKPTEEVFRKMPEDNILERLFTSNTSNKNEYVIASIGLTKANVCDLSLQIALVGFGYQVIRVNVIPEKDSVSKEVENDKKE